jgi:hypothetical protein
MEDDSYNILKPLMLAKSMVATSMNYHCPTLLCTIQNMMPTLVLYGPSKKLSHTMQDDAQEECPTYIVMISILAFSCSLF